MNVGAILLIVLGIALIVMGWQGSYANVWTFLTGQASGVHAQTPTPPQQNQPQLNLQGLHNHVG